MEISKETLRHSAELGFVACRWPAMRDFAMGIFRAVRLAAPDNPAWIIGIAMVYANCDDEPGAACQFMEKEGVSAGSGDLMARAFMGLFLMMAKRTSEARTVLQAVVTDGSDTEAAQLARSALDKPA